MGTLALLAVSNLPNLLTYPNPSGNNCLTSTEVSIARLVLTILFRTYIPFALMVVMDVIVFKRLRQSKRRVGVSQTSLSNQSHHHQISNKEYNFMISTLLIDLSFFVFYTPISIHLTITLTTLFVNYYMIQSHRQLLMFSIVVLYSLLFSIRF